MIRSWLKTAWRYSRNSKLYTFLNLAGLATGAAVTILIGIWVHSETSFDTVHGNYDHIAQGMINQPADGAISTGELLPIPLAAELRSRFGADFRRIALYFPNFTHILTIDNGQALQANESQPARQGSDVASPSGADPAARKSIAQAGSWVQPDLPEMLSLTMLQGRRDALRDPFSVLINHSVAQALFGSANPMGRTIRVDNTIEVKVGGVFEDLPENSSFSDAKLFLSWDKAVEEMAWMKNEQSNWTGQGWKIFVQLHEKADIDHISHKIKDLITAHNKTGNETLFLYPMRRWHLYSEFSNGISTGGRIRIVRLFTGIGILVLVLACINFMNLATARSERRAKEVGIRKVSGSLRHQLIGQFLGEALIMTTLAVFLALAIVQLSLPAFNSLAGKHLRLPWTDPVFGSLLLGFILLTSLLAGSYPAFYLSNFQPVKVLKGNLRSGIQAAYLRKALVVVQFTVSISLIIATVFVDRQVRFAKDRPVGYSRAGLIAIGKNTPELYQARYDALRDDLLRTGAVTDMTQSSSRATEDPGAVNSVAWLGEDPGTHPTFNWTGITPDYGNTLGWQVIAGRDFERTLATDSQKVILNESAAKLIGFRQPLGQSIRVWGQALTIIGVVRDMVAGSPFQRIQPGVYTLINNSQANIITLRVRPAMSIRPALAAIEKVFRKYNPASPFDYQFVDTEYALKFADEERIDGLARAFTLLAIGISCLGLFGLSAYSAERRIREIGIRKVLGSSGFRIWKLLTGEVIKLIGLSCVIAIPLSAIFMHRWLQRYEYRTPLSSWVFMAAAGGALLIALGTVSFHALKAASSNPIKSLRSE